MTSISNCLKKNEFTWSHTATKAFLEIKEKMINATVTRLPPEFCEVFEIAYGALGIGMGEFFLKKGTQSRILVRN